MPRTDEIDILARVASRYGGAEVEDLKGHRAAQCIGKRAMPQAQLVAISRLCWRLIPLCLPGIEPYSISDQSAAGDEQRDNSYLEASPGATFSLPHRPDGLETSSGIGLQLG